MRFKIKYGLGGGFGGANNEEIIEAENQADADKIAYEACCEHYEVYVGMYGLRDIPQIIEEDEVSEDKAFEIFNDERESWLDYYAEPYIEENE